MGKRLLALVVACVAVAAASLALPWRPSFDQWAWLVWGRDAAHLGLTLGAAPSWKPLPVLFTALFSLAGSAGPALWLIVARAGSLLAVAMTARLAARWARGPLRWVAGASAALGLVLVHDFFRRSAVGNAEPLMVAAALLAVERHLDGHRRQALALGVVAALVRPEAWPFLAAYALWLWREREVQRGWIAAWLAVVPVLWLGAPLVGTGDMFQSSHAALGRVPLASAAATQHHGLRVIGLFAGMLPLWTKLATIFALGLAAVRRTPERALAAALSAVALGWVAIVALLAQRGYAGLPRYLFMPAALFSILAGVGLVRAAELARALRRAPRVAAATGLIFAAVAGLSIADVRRLGTDGTTLTHESARDRALATAIDRAGGAQAVLDCGTPVTPWFETSAAAWKLGVNLDQVHAHPQSGPEVVFAYRPGAGWQVAGHCRRDASLGRARARR